MLTFFVPCIPVPQPRPRVYNGRAVSNTAKVTAFKLAVFAAAAEADLLGLLKNGGWFYRSPLHVRLAFSLPVPKRGKPGWHTKRPDLDNLAKATLDALNGVLYRDDAQICSLTLTKQTGATPGVQITVTEAGEP